MSSSSASVRSAAPVSHHLAAGGARVVGIDRFAPPHDQGSSHGLTRITRLAVGEGAAFVPLVMRSHALWPALEAASGETLHRRTGGLVIGSAEADVAKYHGQPGFLAQTVALAERFGIAHELLDAATIRTRFPAFLAGDGERGYFEHDAGVLFPERIVAAPARRGPSPLARPCGSASASTGSDPAPAASR
jgi:sarcosine oxidase